MKRENLSDVEKRMQNLRRSFLYDKFFPIAMFSLACFFMIGFLLGLCVGDETGKYLNSLPEKVVVTFAGLIGSIFCFNMFYTIVCVQTLRGYFDEKISKQNLAEDVVQSEDKVN